VLINNDKKLFKIAPIDRAGNKGDDSNDFGIIRDTIVGESDTKRVSASMICKTLGIIYPVKLADGSFEYTYTVDFSDVKEISGIYKFVPQTVDLLTLIGSTDYIISELPNSCRTTDTVTAKAQTGTLLHNIKYRLSVSDVNSFTNTEKSPKIMIYDHAGNKTEISLSGRIFQKPGTTKATTTIISNEQAGSKEVRSKIEIDAYTTSSGINIKTRTETGKTSTH
jgi:hypothetical protein